ncbi:hypothetical protein HDU88_002248 [Geranomyces variabilis]|nr:hypothetical protein HDU88_002248 [Geranomyces variabilis]
MSPLGAANAVYIDALTMSSAVSALVTYSPSPARGQGSEPSEHHVRNELWVDIFTKSVKLAAGPFVSLWEMWHLFPGNAGKASSRSDFSALAVDAQGESFPFLIVESERPKAYITFKEGGNPIVGADVIEWAKNHSSISTFMMPREVVIVDELPKTSTGKIKKNVLREWAQTHL